MNLKTLPSNGDEVTLTDDSYRQIFRTLPEACLLIDAATPDYVIVDMNRAREKLTGVSRRQAVGRPLFAVFPPIGQQSTADGGRELDSYLAEVVRTGKPKLLKAFRYDRKGKNGATLTRYWQVRYVPIRGDDKRVRYVLSQLRDVTDEVRSTKRAASVEDQLRAALAIGKLGSWAWDIRSDAIVSDKSLIRLFHITKEQLAAGLTIGDFLAAVHPEDRRRIEESIRRSVRARVPFEEECRITLADGTQSWILSRGKVDEYDGRPLFTGVVVDTTERHDLRAQVELAHRQDQLNRRAARILQKRNEELEAIGHSKDEFVALASHQLRTPATAVKQYLGMVLQGYAGDITDIQADMLHKAFESNERQIQIINQILNAARVDTGRLVIAPIPLDLRALVRGVWNDMRSTFEQRRQEFVVGLPRTAVIVTADQTYLRMAIENLLHNASVYTPSGGTISLRLSRAGSNCRLSVTDTGVGIRKTDLGKLFAKFSRIHNPLSVQAGGSGIGLYLASEIVRLHDGTITVESKIHKGSTFAISLPLMQK